jgi:hypothetical protein
MNDGEDESEIKKVADPMKFRSMISKFAQEDGARRNTRSSPTKITTVKRESSAISSTSASPKKRHKPLVKREYAPPEQYAHLKQLSDYLKRDLDGKFNKLEINFVIEWSQSSCYLWNKV